eukprot:scaffold28928_cov13-Tisochrysis_lutea.AAC.1
MGQGSGGECQEQGGVAGMVLDGTAPLSSGDPGHSVGGAPGQGYDGAADGDGVGGSPSLGAAAEENEGEV